MIFDSGSSPPHGAEGTTPPADLNEGADPHYPFKDMLIGAALTDAGLLDPAPQHVRQPKKICADPPFEGAGLTGLCRSD